MNRPVLVIGAGQIGLAIAKRLGASGADVHLHCRTATETAMRVERLRSAGIVAIGTSAGDLLLEGSDLEIGGATVVRGGAHRLEVNTRDPGEGPLDAEAHVTALIAQLQPGVVIDATNMATVDKGEFDQLGRSLGLAGLPAFARRAVRDRLLSNALIRYTLRLGLACEATGVERLLKVSTTGLGGMGLDLPFTHGDHPQPLLSEQIWAKLQLAGIQLQVLATLARSVSLAIHVVVPATCIGFDEQIMRVEAPGECALAAVDCGENLAYGRGEVALLTHPKMMGAATKDEVAAAAASILAGDGRFDALRGLQRAYVGPSEAGQEEAQAACARLAAAEGIVTVTTGNLGPHVASALFEASALRAAFGERWPVCIMDETADSMARNARDAFERTPALTAQLRRLNGRLASDDESSTDGIVVDLGISRMTWWRDHARGSELDTLLAVVRTPEFRRAHAVTDLGSATGERLRAIIEGFSTSRVVLEAIALGVFEHGGIDVPALAERLNVDPEALQRLCRAVAALGLEPSEILKSDHPRSLAPMAHFALMAGWPAWSRLGDAVRSGRSPAEGTSPFAAFAQDDSLARRFNDQMAKATQRTASRLAPHLRGHRILDVGGGEGVLADELLRLDPLVHVTVLDLEYAAPGARERLAPHQGRAQFRAGDFFREIPAGFDLLVLSRVLHDWNDDNALRLLERCTAATAPGATIAVFDKMPDLARAEPTVHLDFALADLNTWLMCGGRERTVTETSNLVEAAGFSVSRIVPIASAHQLLIAERVKRDP